MLESWVQIYCATVFYSGAVREDGVRGQPRWSWEEPRGLPLVVAPHCHVPPYGPWMSMGPPWTALGPPMRGPWAARGPWVAQRPAMGRPCAGYGWPIGDPCPCAAHQGAASELGRKKQRSDHGLYDISLGSRKEQMPSNSVTPVQKFQYCLGRRTA